MKSIQQKNLSIDFRGQKYEIKNIYTFGRLSDDHIEMSIKINTPDGFKSYVLTDDEASEWLPSFKELKEKERELNEEYSNIQKDRMEYIYKIDNYLKVFEENGLHKENIQMRGNTAEMVYSPIKNDILYELLEETAYEYQDDNHNNSVIDTENTTIIRIEFDDGYNLID